MKLNKFLSFTATVLLLAGVVGCGNNPAPEVNPNIGKRFTENGYTLYFDPLMHGEGVTIEKYEGTDHFPTIPTTFKDAPVVELADEAFKGNKDVYAVNIPTSIIALGEYVFSECTNLVSVYMPSSILFAQDYIFSKSSRVSVYLEDSQSKVAEKIEAYDFSDSWDKGMTSSPTYGVSSAPTVTIEDNFVFVEDSKGLKVSNFVGNKLTTSITLPSTLEDKPVTMIGTSAFVNLLGIESVTIPDNYTNIGINAFNGDINLETVTLGKGVRYVYSYAFQDCTALSTVNFNEGLIGISVLAFSRCSSLKSVTLPSTLESIGISAFSGCDLSTLVIPDSVITIEANAFYNNANLAKVVLGKGISKMEPSAFNECAFRNNKVYYVGSESEWALIREVQTSSAFSWGDSTVTYFYSETEPATSGHYWHYVNEEVVEW